MKILRSNHSILLLFLAFFSACTTIPAQEAAKGAIDMESLIKKRDFIFTAKTANPMRGSVVQLTSNYDVVLRNDSLITFLPYFGRAFSAPSYNREGGIKITTTEFKYEVSDKRKKRWNITITPNDDQDVRQLLLSVSENGYAHLRVVSNNRDPITFTGTVTAR